MAPNGSEWLQIARNNSKWLEMAPNGSESVKPFKKMPKGAKKGAKQFFFKAESAVKWKKIKNK